MNWYKSIKLLEDFKVQYDGTVTDCSNSIFQSSYGEDSFDPKCLVKVKGGTLEVCDVSNIVNKLNMKLEVKNSKKIVKQKTKDVEELFGEMKI
jgi:hypothetical protein